MSKLHCFSGKSVLKVALASLLFQYFGSILVLEKLKEKGTRVFSTGLEVLLRIR